MFYVLAVWSHTDPLVVELTIDGETIETTLEHPFYTADGTWIAAGDLQPGDELRNAAWQTGTVEAVFVTYRPQPMYNFTVAAAHTYFVGDARWLVHNACRFITTAKGTLKTTQNVGDTRLFLQRTWHQGTFASELDSAAYHLNRHGYGTSIQEYTAEAQGFFRRWWRTAEEVPSSISSETFYRIRNDHGFGIFTKDGKVVTYESFGY